MPTDALAALDFEPVPPSERDPAAAAFFRSLYPLPGDWDIDRETLTLGYLRSIVEDIFRLEEARSKGYDPTRIEWERHQRIFCVSYATWFTPLQFYLNTEMRRDVTVEALDELIGLLSGRLRKRFDEIRQLPVRKVVEALTGALTEDIIPHRDDERDQFALNQYTDPNIPLKAIVKAINARSDWNPITNEDHLLKRLKAYCNRQRPPIDMPRRNKPRNRRK